MWTDNGLVQVRTQFDATIPTIDPSIVFSTLVDAGVAELYPGFQGWFFGKVIPGLQDGQRSIAPWIVDSRLAGVAICKRTVAERKLSTLWICPKFQQRGIARELARIAFRWLGTSQPLFTVPEEHFHQFGTLLKVWSFPKYVAYRDLYRASRIEYVFNGPLNGEGSLN
ncbi:hypothetical protein [Prosthecodimorpha hirschii]|uniref:hypothetical protein n=1 Tax=Prosthecodimorpha hirschii TaxID=665126 RepID=UPI001127F379|nr:hypothetical protein [Prosthecomicrobium hirschii]